MTAFERLTGWLARLSGRGDLVIAALMLVAVAMMIIPLPTFLVDVLITCNIAISLLILLAAIYVTQPLQFSSMPAVILISTVFRLAITISTARLILLQADAGHMVSAFGTFVVGGSVAVGLITFLIITIAQFVVVAKGAERVAEVAARFTLDALPGKQMSIDAELRNGDIDQAEARRLRQQLERESQLFGAMDGAMKFVKGDVIASIIVILVNLIGGISIGTLQHEMTIGEAASTYSLLTVGDGLVAQIPSLLVAVAAGTMVTRVGSADGEGDLGRQVTRQLLRDSRALTLAAAIMLGLSLVPGFPMPIFLTLGAAFGLGAYAARRRTATSQPGTGAEAVQLARDPTSMPKSENSIEDQTSSFPILVELGPAVEKILPKDAFERMAEQVRRDISGDLGIAVPRIGARAGASLGQDRLRIDLDGAPVLDVEIAPDSVMVEGEVANLRLAGVPFEKTRSAGPREAFLVKQDHAGALREAGITYHAPAAVIEIWLKRALRLYAGTFVGIQETRKLLASMEDEYNELVRQAQEHVNLQKIAEVLRRLVEENVPVRNLRLVLEALVEWGPKEKDVAILTEHVRAALKRQISYRVADGSGIVAAFVLQRSAEDVLRGAVKTGAAGTFLNLSDESAQPIVYQVESALGDSTSETLPVVVTAADVRRHMRDLLVSNGVELPVLSFQELASEFSVQPLVMIEANLPVRATGRIASLAGRDATAST